MDIQYFGANCVRLSTKKATVVVDDNLATLGQKSVTKTGDIALVTSPIVKIPEAETKITIDMPGEYEVSNISVQGIPARSHMDQDDKQTAVMYKIIADDVRIAVVGHIYPDLSEAQLEVLGTIDVLIIPVGNSGYTMDSIGALKVIKKIEPATVIPVHFGDKGLKYEVPQQALEEALKGLAMEPKETVAKFKPTRSTESTEKTELVLLERQ